MFYPRVERVCRSTLSNCLTAMRFSWDSDKTRTSDKTLESKSGTRRKSSLIEDVDDINGGGKRASIHPCKPFDIDTNHSLNTIMRAWDDFFILYPS